MDEVSSPTLREQCPHDRNDHLRAVLRGRASAGLLRPLLDDFTVDHTTAGATRLIGRVVDPSHLHGVLAHLTSVGIELISVGPVSPTRRRAAPVSDELGPTIGVRT